MSTSTPPRRAALRILVAVRRGRKLDEAFHDGVEGLEERDRAWVHELVRGVERYRGRLDHLLSLHVKGGLDRLDPDVLELLRMGAAQLVLLGSVPDHAAVSQTVGQVRASRGRGAAGLANAVLRRLAEAGGGPERFPSLEEDPVGHLSTWGSHPRWLVERWVAAWGPEEAARVVAAGNRIPETWIVALPDGEAVRLAPGEDPGQALEEEGRAGRKALVQDPSSRAVTKWIGAGPGDRVADLSAAPGGKAMGLAASGARVVAADVSKARLRRVVENRDRLGLRVGVVVADARHPPLALGSQDLVLLDAPCSGTGTLARHPDLRWRLSEAGIQALARLQDELLDGAAPAVRPGGQLVYSTCTLEPEENMDRVTAFLARHPEFRLAPDGVLDIRPGAGAAAGAHGAEGGDGAFAARLVRAPDPNGHDGDT
ncbi:MAG: hypothetical protein EA352_04085 [Gemmatimonadales bacterium]|nr:MAG: hypothetical protein EA352_04085 [Gemmatimonadales bacterium]